MAFFLVVVVLELCCGGARLFYASLRFDLTGKKKSVIRMQLFLSACYENTFFHRLNHSLSKHSQWGFGMLFGMLLGEGAGT